MAKNKADESTDACPFPPDGDPPPKTPTTNIIEHVESFFEGWRNYFAVLTLASLVLTYSLLVVPPPLITEASIPDTWGMQYEPKERPLDRFKWINVSDPEQNHTGQMILDGDMVMEIVDQTIVFNDLVLVKDNACIILRNSTLIVPEYRYRYENIFKEYAAMVFNDSARLEAYDSIILPSDWMPNIGFIGGSSCILENTVIANTSLSFDESACLFAKNSSIWGVCADGYSDVTLDDSYLHRIYQKNSWRHRTANPITRYDTSVVLKNTEADLILLRVVNSSSIDISEKIGWREHWNSYDYYKIDGYTMNVTLFDSEINELLWVYCINSNVNVTETEVCVLQTSMSNVTVVDSKVDFLVLGANSSADIDDSYIYSYSAAPYLPYEEYLGERLRGSFYQNAVINGSRIEYLDFYSDSDMFFEDVYIGEVVVDAVETRLEGSVRWGEDMTDRYGSHSRFAVKQVFDVVAQGEERVISGAKLTLTDEDGEIVWEGSTNENGKARFNITFCAYYPLYEPYRYVTNFRDEWRLTSMSSGVTLEETVKLFETGSPIVFDFPEDKQTTPINNRILTFGSMATIILVTAMRLRKHFL